MNETNPHQTTSPELSRLAVHTITTKPWSFAEAADQYSRQGIGGISVWVEAIDGIQPTTARQIVDDAGLKVPALVRGGFFCAGDQRQRDGRIDHNLRLLETAAELGAEMLVLVVGATPGVALETQRGWVREGIEQILPQASSLNVRLAIEPLHPMYAADKSCINRITEARQICEAIDDPVLGVAVDVYHVWWDPDLAIEIELIGAQNRIFGFHICDWRVPTRDMLNDRALMGEGCIDIRSIRAMVEAAGFDGWNEVEIFSEEHWRGDQKQFLKRIVESYCDC
ncbi:Xylose isomerase-like TIM barrel [Rubripirellula lacrimiformis]|uniref:Xylose isomerase-like TIM barrel n=1 Tax=Rubripirellula lacrimiformis TaxID=1930273 RepID=A0A517NAV7_9BACT|nr:sugar phosphate isomerase/epimerase family protein [Rubripirellula lacrimiformis]QDT04267.1 Xylose isomerase-like TIM barrel [Rubripirellula lacrimiformis]